MPELVMLARGGRWFGILAIEGQTALIILVQALNDEMGQQRLRASLDIHIVTHYTTEDPMFSWLGKVRE